MGYSGIENGYGTVIPLGGVQSGYVDALNVLSVNSLHGWWASDFGVTSDGSGNISQVNDKSGNGRHATQATGANQPNLIADGGATFNNRPVMRFNGTTDFLQIADFDYGDYTKLNVWLVFNSSTPFFGALISHWGTAVASWEILDLPASSVIAYMLSQNGFTTVKNYRNAISTNITYLSSFGYNTDTLSIYLDGVLQTPTKVADNPITAIFDSTTTLKIGCTTTGSPVLFWTGDIAEVIMAGAVTAAERTLIDRYLLLKYGI